MGKNLRNSVVIGATGNLGRAICKILSDEGFYVDPLWQRPDHPDATDSGSYKNLPEQIDAAIYLPGINKIELAENLKETDWDSVLNVNLRGAYLFAKAAFPAMKRSGNAIFVTISSIMTTHPYPGRLAYAAAKSGLEALTRVLAVEWGKYGISTHCIRLGHLEGLMKSTGSNPQLLEAVKSKTPSSKLIDSECVAKFILWLAEGGGKAVSGCVIDFDPAYIINRWPL